MKITFLSNYMNHHQIPLCRALRRELGDDFIFIQTEPMEEERLRMGWNAADADLAFVLRGDTAASDEQLREKIRERVLGCDILLAGWAPTAADLIVERVRAGKITFRISERIYKDGQWKAVSPRGLLSKWKEYSRFRRAPYYLLCAGAYVASDFKLIGAFPRKMLRWGYFPQVRTYAEGELLKVKRSRPLGEEAQLIWAGRFVDFKNPWMIPELVNRLADKGASFHLHIAGGGEGEEEMRRSLAEKGLDRYVTFHGFMPPDAVRDLMEQCDIHVMTSDAGEGWGAVLNESMNSGCAVAAGTEAGAVPYLVRNGINGLLYEHRDLEALTEAVLRLVNDPALRERLGQEACRTVTELWNAETAAERLLQVCDTLLKEGSPAAEGKLPDPVWQDGPMSRDPVLRPYLKV